MPTKQEAIEKINKMIGEIKVAMLTTADENGDFHSRPMITQDHHFDGDVWFFAENSSDKVREIERNPFVNVSYVGDSDYVSIAGIGHIVNDIQKKKDRWHDALKIWFEDGPESPEVTLIHIDAKSAQYWDTPSNPVSKAFSVVKVILTGSENAAGDSEKVQFS